jgi:hypothetical protein
MVNSDPPNEIGFGQIDSSYKQHLETIPVDDDGPIWMVSMQRAEGGLDRLQSVADVGGGEVVLAGDVIRQVDGDAPHWNQLTVVKFPTRRNFVQLAHHPAFKHHPGFDHMQLHEAIILGCIPSPSMPTPAQLTVPTWNAVPHPATDDDSPVVAVHAVRYADSDWSPDDMAAYAHALAAASVPHGARGTRWFAVEGTIVGDGRHWDDVRFTMYPSMSAFLAVVNDLDHITAYERHRAHLIADKYTLVMRPRIDRLARSIC